LEALARIGGLVHAAGDARAPDPAARLESAGRALADDLLAVIDLPHQARGLGWSYAHFRLVFARRFGVGPGAWRLRHRLDHARHLLRERGLPVAAVAEAVGYRDPFAFSRIFSRHAGCSPSAYAASASATTITGPATAAGRRGSGSR
jgi:transcriptional regulator GlxA family with amidase domain